MRKSVKTTALAAVLALAFATSACSGNDVRNSLGLSVNSPDEFMVMTHPPLEQPKDFSLPKPGDAPDDLANNRLTSEAEATLFRKNGSSDKPVTKGESALLQKADAKEVDPDIRRKLYAERQAAVQKRLEREDSTLGSLNPWTQNEKDPVVDSGAEQKRIAEAQKEGKPITSDGVKEKERKPKAPLEGIFN